MRKENASGFLLRFALYLLGMTVLAVGLVLNTKVTLGTAAILSVPYSLSVIGQRNLGDLTLIWYCIFILAELLLHLNVQAEKRKTVLLFDLLQLPFSLVFTRLINLFSSLLPAFEAAYPDSFPGSLAGRLLILLAAIVLTGVGAALSLDMRLVPNPSDGIVQAIADRVGMKIGTVKNLFDFTCVALTTAISLLAAGRLVGVGIGTVISMLLTGRVLAAFNRLAGHKLTERLHLN